MACSYGRLFSGALSVSPEPLLLGRPRHQRRRGDRAPFTFATTSTIRPRSRGATATTLHANPPRAAKKRENGSASSHDECLHKPDDADRNEKAQETSEASSVVMGNASSPILSGRRDVLAMGTLALMASAFAPNLEVARASMTLAPVAAGLAGGTALVTGCSSGIGFSVAEGLLRQGYTVVPAARSMKRTKEAADKLLAQVPGGKVECLDVPCDLSSINSVDEFAAAYLSSGLPLQSLMECAGIAWCDDLIKSADGLELQFATNHLGHHHLANRLLPLMRSSSSSSSSLPAPRLVVMSSSAHYAGSCNPAALVGAAAPHAYNRWLNYCDSKLCNVLFAKEAQRREDALQSPVTAVSVHPGIVNTNLIRYITPPSVMQQREQDIEKSLRVGKFLGLLTPEEGAEGALWLANADASSLQPGGYYQCLAPPKLTDPLAAAKDPALGAALWAASDVLVARALGKAVPEDAYRVASALNTSASDGVADLMPGFLRMTMTN